MSNPLSIALVCGHYLPELGYIEVDLAREWQRAGHQVTVITSDVVPDYVSSKVKTALTAGLSEDNGIRLHRLSPIYAYGQIIEGRGIARIVDELSPQLVVTIGLGKRWPLPILRAKRSYRLAALLGDNHAGYSRKKGLVDRLLKHPVYRQAVRHSDVLLAYTPESAEIVSEMLSPGEREQLNAKCQEISLGFDSDHFYFDQRLRQAMRDRHGLTETDRVAVTATRCSPEKQLDVLLKTMESAIASGRLHSYYLIGAAQDATSEALRLIAKSSPVADRLHIIDMAEKEALLQYFHLADIGLWPRAAISIFQALGTGLPLILPMAKSVEHILLDGQGIRKDVTDIRAEDLDYVDTAQPRKEIADSAESRFSTAHQARNALALAMGGVSR